MKPAEEPSRLSPTVPPTGSTARALLRPRTYVVIGAAILVVAALWRIAIMSAMPVVTRDSVMFCHHAEQLGQEGLSYLRDPAFGQHPLFPALVLGAQRLALAAGGSDSPLTWQRSGQGVSLLAGLAVVVLSGVLARRLVRRLDLPLDDRLCACTAMALAAVTPLNVWLSVEVMSDQTHAAFYLLGAWALLGLNERRSALLAGLASGLAFLTRPEGIVIAIAGLGALAVWKPLSIRRRAAHAALLLTGFIACAAPYWILSGSLSSKKNPLNWLHDDEAAITEQAPDLAVLPARLPDWPQFADPPLPTTVRPMPAAAAGLLAKLERLDVAWYAIVPYALYVLLRAGRVVIALLALPPLLNLRKQLDRPPLVGLVAALSGHFLLALVLLGKFGYLAPRHMLVAILLLTPFSATLLSRLVELALRRKWQPAAAFTVIALLLAPLLLYALRVPNAADAYLRDVARWVETRDPDIDGKTLMSGASPRRVAFYTGAEWLYWYEEPAAVDTLLRRIRADQPDYFLIETGSGFERTGNEAVVERLRAQALSAAYPITEATRDIPAGTAHLFAFDWPDG